MMLNGKPLHYIVKYSHRIRGFRIELRPDSRVNVVIPHGFPLSKVPGILKSRAKWLLSRLERLIHVQAMAPISIKNGDTVPYLGKELKLVLLEKQPDSNVSLTDNKLTVSVDSQFTTERLLEDWYRAQAEKYLENKAQDISAGLGLSFTRLCIRGQKTRWGSCSRRGNLSLNWKLMMAPEPVIDYVIIHELCHLKQMNHSKRFWKLVEKFCPDFRSYRKWLKDNEIRLAGIISPNARISL